MMKSLLACLLFSTAALAAPLSGEVQDFNFNYSDPKGSGSASVFQMSEGFLDEGVKVDLEKKDNVFFINVSGAHNQNFEFKDAPSVMTSAKDMAIEGFNLSLKDSLSMSVADATFDSEKDSLNLKNLALNCSRDSSSTEVMDQLLNGCIQKMGLKSAEFSSTSNKSQAALLMVAQAMSRAVGNKSRGGVTIKSMDLKINAGKYDLSADLRAQISGRVKSNGVMSYDKTSGVLTVRINEVKLGILGVTGQVFNELKKNESEKFKVKQPNIFITIK